jgi:cobalt-zinc-cadmium efflux system membrane fusion protein
MMIRALGLVVLCLPAFVAGCNTASASTGSGADYRPSLGVPVIDKPAEVSLSPDEIKQADIQVAPFAERPVETAIRASGRIAWDDLRVAHIFSPVTGRVTRISAGLGERVHKGSTLASIVSPDIGQWSSDMGKANADLIAAEHDFKRKRELLDLKAVARADYEASEDTYRQAKAEMERAQQKIAMLRSGGADFVSQIFSLPSPIDGEVIARMVNPGLEIQGQYDNGNTTELFTVGERDTMWLLSDVYEADIARVAVGAKVSVTTLAIPGKTFEGTLDWISGALDPSTRTVQVRCTLANPEKLLKPDMYATGQISTPDLDALAVPRSAVVHYGEQQVVFAELPGEGGQRRFARMAVKVDERADGDWLPVSHGLEKGAIIVSNGAKALQEKL